MLTKVVASAVSVLLLIGFGYGWYEYRSLNSGIQRMHLPSLVGENTDPQPGHHTTGVEQNILVVGMDSRAGLSAAERRLLSVGSDNSLSTDTIMIIHVPADGSKATMISIPLCPFRGKRRSFASMESLRTTRAMTFRWII